MRASSYAAAATSLVGHPLPHSALPCLLGNDPGGVHRYCGADGRLSDRGLPDPDEGPEQPGAGHGLACGSLQTK